jgi:parallel beta-helix repeat protein
MTQKIKKTPARYPTTNFKESPMFLMNSIDRLPSKNTRSWLGTLHISFVALTALLVQVLSTPLFATNHIVSPGQTIQSAIDRAVPGDVILIEPAIYQESLYVDKPNLTIRGVQREGRLPRLDGKGILNDGVIASASHFKIDRLEITNYKGNGVMTQGANEVEITNLIVRDTGIYGIYPTLGKKIRIENNVVSGIADAGIYIGMCEYVDVKQNDVYENVAGIEIENSRYALVAHNSVYRNTGGILVFALPGLPRKKTENILITGNQVFNNNHYNFGAPGSTVANIPPGSGVIILASSRVDVTRNIIRDHQTAGLIVVDHKAMPGLGPDPEVDPTPQEIRFFNNLLISPQTRPFSHYLAWYHYVGRSLLAGNVAEGALEEIFPRTFDVHGSGEGRNLCIDNSDGLKINGRSLFETCDVTPSPWLRDLLAADSLTSQDTSARSIDSKAVSFADLASAIPSPTTAQASPELVGETVYNNVCSGCHALSMQRIGPSLKEIAKKYDKNPEGIIRFASNPIKVRDGFPTMPSQAYLGQTKLEAAARYILKLAGEESKSH